MKKIKFRYATINDSKKAEKIITIQHKQKRGYIKV